MPESSSSALNFQGLSTPQTAGYGNISRPSSPSLATSDATARRRLSWNRVDAGQDPLRAPAFVAATQMDHEAESHRGEGSSGPAKEPWDSDDPFSSPTREMFPSSPSYRTLRNGDEHVRYDSINSFSTNQSGPSSASLVPPVANHERDDDEAFLTSHIAGSAGEHANGWSREGDAERNIASSSTPRQKRRAGVRYSLTPSPGSQLRRTGSRVASMSRNLRRMSLRVVNLGNNSGPAGFENSIRLPDDDEPYPQDGQGERTFADEDAKEESMYDMRRRLPLRGRTLGFLGPTSRVRSAMYNFLVYPCVPRPFFNFTMIDWMA